MGKKTVMGKTGNGGRWGMGEKRGELRKCRGAKKKKKKEIRKGGKKEKEEERKRVKKEIRGRKKMKERGKSGEEVPRDGRANGDASPGREKGQGSGKPPGKLAFPEARALMASDGVQGREESARGGKRGRSGEEGARNRGEFERASVSFV